MGCFELAIHRGKAIYQVFNKVGDTQRAKASKRQPSDGGVLVPTVLGEQVDSQQRELRDALGISTDVKIQHLLQLQVVVVGDSAVDDLHEQAAHVDADGHVVDYLLEDVLLGFDAIWFAVAWPAEIGKACPNLA